MCQVHRAVSALVQSCCLAGDASDALLERTANTIQHWQRRNRAARTQHIRRTRKKLRRLGMTLKDLIRCKWP